MAILIPIPGSVRSSIHKIEDGKENDVDGECCETDSNTGLIPWGLGSKESLR
jgi:hypothetical protein